MATTKTTYAIAQGSGVIYDLNRDAGNAIIITNYHVVYDYESDNGVADSIDLYLYGGLDGYSVTRNYSGEVTAYSAAAAVFTLPSSAARRNTISRFWRYRAARC